MARAADLLQDDAALNALPGVRLQATGFVGGAASDQPLPAMELAVAVHRPGVWGPGCTLKQAQADYVSPAKVAVHFNTLEPLLRLLATPDGPGEAGWFAAPAMATTGRGERLYGRRVVLLSAPGLPPVLPLTVDEYLGHWERTLAEMAAFAPGSAAAAELAALRLHRAGLRASERQAPVALAATAEAAPVWAYSRADAAGAQPLLRDNRPLGRGAAPGAVRLVVLEVWINHEGDELTGTLEDWLARVDTRPYAALLQP
jgi:hypothetical protein